MKAYSLAVSPLGSIFNPNFVSTANIDIKISIQPINILRVNLSCSSITENIVPNTDSVLNMIAVLVEDVYFCPIV